LVRRGGGRAPLVTVKDWRAGRQRLSVPGGEPNGAFGDMLTIFRSWGVRLTGLLVAVTGRDADRTAF